MELCKGLGRRVWNVGGGVDGWEVAGCVDGTKSCCLCKNDNRGKGISRNSGTLTIKLSIFVPYTVALCMTLAARKVSGQSADAQTSAQVYNPYPPGILPSDLNPEIERVRRELLVI